jgi:hypothetical protein
MLGKYFFVALVFLALILISAGIGAMAAGETTLGATFLSIGLILLLVDIYLIRKFRHKLLS